MRLSRHEAIEVIRSFNADEEAMSGFEESDKIQEYTPSLDEVLPRWALWISWRIPKHALNEIVAADISPKSFPVRRICKEQCFVQGIEGLIFPVSIRPKLLDNLASIIGIPVMLFDNLACLDLVRLVGVVRFADDHEPIW